MLNVQVLVAALILLAACGEDFRVASRIDLPSVLAHAAANRDTREFRVSEHTDFNWRELVILGPYTNQKAADAALGFHWAGYSDYTSEMSDSFFVMVFVKENSVVRALKIPRCSPDFAVPDLRKRIPVSRAKFLVVGQDSSCPEFRLAAA